MTFTKCLTSNVTFLGGILDEESISIHERPDEIVGRTEINRQPQPAIYDVLIARNADIKYIGGPIFKSEFDMLKEKEVKLTAIGELTGMKQIPQRQFDKVKVSYKTYPLQVKGPVRFREVVYRPKLPNYLRWDEELGVDLDRLGDSFEMELKFWVSPEGRVEFVERVSSSGHPTVDLVGIRYLKGWQFAPLVVGESKDEQWGIVKLNFNLTKELK
ncbi:MAG: hypothetical protein AMJ78_10030 [Omnitrophica WOR_2 bacterium SM23_29]|nr:MAG: hypothetical protein AMJ78_10030 [Omnitrophica WOR_2 bacterium SM23_29]